MAQKQTDPIPYYIETAPGLEEVAWVEIRNRFPQAGFEALLFAKDERGVVVFDYPGKWSQLFSLRMAEAVFLTVAYMDKISRGYNDLKELRRQMIQTGDLGRAVNLYARYRSAKPTTYRLTIRKYGRHEYRPQDVWQTLSATVNNLYPEWEQAAADATADIDLWANVFGSNILVGISLPEPKERRRSRREAAVVRPSVGAAMTILTEPQPTDLFLDPLCAEGDLLLERAQAGPARLILGGDTPPSAVSSAGRRLGEEGVVCRWLPQALPLAAASVDKVASHWPTSSPGAFGRWLGELNRVLKPGGKAMILTPSYDPFKDAIRAYPGLTILGGYSVKIGGTWGRLYTVQRT